MLFNALVATVNPGDEVIIPAPYWVSYPDIVHVRGRQAGDRATKLEDGFKMQAGRARARDHAEDEVADLQLAVEPDRRGLYARGARRR